MANISRSTVYGQDRPRTWPSCRSEALLGLAERSVVHRREAEVDDLRVLAAWAEVHSTDPRHDPDTGRRVWAEDRLVHPGGEGTPGVREFSIPALAMARQVSAHGVWARPGRRARPDPPAAAGLGADPGARVSGVAGPQGRPPLAPACRPTRVGIVDAAVAEAIGGEAPGSGAGDLRGQGDRGRRRRPRRTGGGATPAPLRRPVPRRRVRAAARDRPASTPATRSGSTRWSTGSPT